MLIFHIIAGSLVLLFGIGSLTFSKGKKLHRQSGNLFFLSLNLMAGSAMFLSDDPIVPLTSMYFAATAWAIVIRPEKKTGFFEIIAFITISILTARYFIVATSTAPSFMSTMFYIFGSVSLLATILDLNMIIRGGLSGAHRIARHLWRMCYALSGAVLSFAANTADTWPEFINPYAPNLILIALIIFWLIRVFFTKWLNTKNSVLKVSS